VIGILNERPNGPCINTKADIEKVRRAILDFLEGPQPSGRSEKLKMDPLHPSNRLMENPRTDHS
jgi:hypothetical protein